MGALEPPHTSRLAGSALHDRALGPVKHSRNDKPTEEEHKSPDQTQSPRRLCLDVDWFLEFLFCQVGSSLFIFHQVVSPHQPPNKSPMHSVPLWIAAALYFVTLFCWQSHYVTALDQALRFPSYRSLQLDPSLD
jgi:hypothetical protein